MDSSEIRKKLSSLSDREREVLGYFCQEMRYVDIGLEIGLAEGTVKIYMSHIFHKLGIAEHPKGERRQILLEMFCPVLKTETLDEPPPEPDLPDQLSEEEEEIIDQLQYPLVVIDTKDLVPPPDDDPPPRSCLPLFFRVLLGVILIAVIALGLVWGRDLITSRKAEATIPIDTLVAQALTATFEHQTIEPIEPTDIEESPTAEEEPTLTISLPTDTFVPTAISPPQPAMELPFSDNFDNGAKPEWQSFLGTWRMVDGRYTADKSDTWSITFVGDEGWMDYAVEVDIYSYIRRPIRILVRVQGNHTYMVFETGSELTAAVSKWILVEGGASTTIAKGDEGGLRGGTAGYMKTHLRIEVQGNVFSAYSDGQLLLRVQDDTLAWGRVGLGLQDSSNDTTKFDNFRVEPID